MKCCICGKEIEHVKGHDGRIWKEGHDARPVKKGRCCAKCNKEVVIPRRLVEWKD
jgi:hypothetical protein